MGLRISLIYGRKKGNKYYYSAWVRIKGKDVCLGSIALDTPNLAGLEKIGLVKIIQTKPKTIYRTREFSNEEELAKYLMELKRKGYFKPITRKSILDYIKERVYGKPKPKSKSKKGTSTSNKSTSSNQNKGASTKKSSGQSGVEKKTEKKERSDKVGLIGTAVAGASGLAVVYASNPSAFNTGQFLTNVAWILGGFFAFIIGVIIYKKVFKK